MNSNTIHFVVSLKIDPARMSDFERIARQMCQVSSAEQGTLRYDWFLDADRQHCRLLETYVDDAAMMDHIHGDAVQKFVPQLLKCSSITSFEIYGSPGAEGAAILQGMKATMFAPWQAAKG